MAKIALFGTSADPPTIGHEEILVWLADRFDRVAVWAADNPLKSGQTPLEHRLTMLRLLIDELATAYPNLGCYPEISHPHTLETLARSRKIWPNDSFTLVIGSDLIAQLSKWYRAEELLKQVDILVVPRPGYPLKSDSVENLRQRGTAVSIADGLEVPAVSSREYRETRNCDRVTPPMIQQYIQRQNLYNYQDMTVNHVGNHVRNNASTRRKT